MEAPGDYVTSSNHSSENVNLLERCRGLPFFSDEPGTAGKPSISDATCPSAGTLVRELGFSSRQCLAR